MADLPQLDDYLGGDVEFPSNVENPEAEVAKSARRYLADCHEHLSDLHRSGSSGAQVIALNSDLVDRLIRRLFELAEYGFFSEAGGEPSPLCVLAVGGYARREMNLHSDVDLLFLYRGSLTPHIANVAERMLYWLWDAAVTVGGATRTIAETISLAKRDRSVHTSVLDPRFLAGSGVLFHEFTATLHRDLVSHPDRFIASQIDAQEARHTAFGDTLYLLQPNVKESAGGLRDYHFAYWVMQGTQPSSRGLEGFLHLGLLTEEEVTEYRTALDFMWRLRNELHLLAGRKTDRMSFELQERVAEHLDYGRAEGRDSELPVERFMSDYYRYARVIENCSSLVVEQCRARVRKRGRRRRVREISGGFRVAEGQLEIPNARQLREDPKQLLSAFAMAQAQDVELTRKARRMVRENLDQIDDGFRRDPEVHAVFEKILSSDQRVTRSLLMMNEIGLLARFLPEWEHIVYRWQHVKFHTYTVDVHSIFLVRELRRLWSGKYQREFPDLTELMRSVDDLPVVYLGCLLHDIGKGFGGNNHSEIGTRRAEKTLERLNYSGDRARRVTFLVEYHLLMSHLAQRRDLSDAKMVLEFARTVGDRTNLRNLFLVTFADMRAASSEAWNDWKGGLIVELFERTAEVLETGADTPGKAIELIEKRVDQRRVVAAEELRNIGVRQEDVDAFYTEMPRRYFTAHTPHQIVRHARVLLDMEPEQLLATGVREMRSDFSELIVWTRDTHALYSKIAGLLTAHDLNILGAHVYTTRSGLALEVYRVSTPAGGEQEREIVWSEFEASLRAVLSGDAQVGDILIRRGRSIGRTASPNPQPVTVFATNEESDFYTIVDVSANDRLGLLHDLTRVIADHSYEVYISKASTILDQVTDTFYLKDSEGKKLTDVKAIERLRLDLLRVAVRSEFIAEG